MIIYNILASAVKPSPSRKRSLTHGDAEDRAKKARLTAELTNSVNRLSRPRTVSAIGITYIYILHTARI